MCNVQFADGSPGIELQYGVMLSPLFDSKGKQVGRRGGDWGTAVMLYFKYNVHQQLWANFQNVITMFSIIDVELDYNFIVWTFSSANS